MDVHFTSPGRDRKCKFPAAFISKSCAVLVFSRKGSEKAPKTVNAATTLYFAILPDARAAAEQFVKKCLSGKSKKVGGSKLTSSRLRTALVQYWVMVGPSPPNLRGDGHSGRPSRLSEKRRGVALERPRVKSGGGRYRRSRWRSSLAALSLDEGPSHYNLVLDVVVLPARFCGL